MAAIVVQKMIDIPDEVTLNLAGKKVTVSGERGQVIKNFRHTRLDMEHEDNTLRIWAVNPKKREASLVNTITAHVNNMIKGVTQGFTYKLKIVFVHFPMTVRVEGRRIVIQNFIGERKDREAKIVGDVKVSVEKEDIVVQGVDIDEVAQTAANIQQACKIRKKDLRKFLDGIYVYSKE
jgi:large subunit ribosomal protein L6